MSLDQPLVSPQLKPRILSLPVLSWALYDFANTIFAMNVLSLYFVLWVTQDYGAKQSSFSLALSASMLAVAVTCPMFGAVSDRYGRRIPFLIAFVLTCVAFTAVIGQVGGLVVALIFFAIANYAYQSGNVFYDSLLPTISREDNRGRVFRSRGGLGLRRHHRRNTDGGPLRRPMGTWRRLPAHGSAVFTFRHTLLLFVKERPSSVPWSARLIMQGYSQLFHTLSNARRHSNLLRFIGARFLYVDAVNTLLIFMAVYVTEVIGFTDAQVRWLLITSTSFAIVGSLLYGRLVDRIGPKKTLTIVLIQWAVVFVGAATTFYSPAFWVIGALAGVALGGTWTADRAFLTRLAPPEQTGEFFGLYQLAGRFAAVTGPLIWGLTVDGLTDLGLLRFRIAILVLLVNVVLGFIVLMGVREGVEESRQPVASADTSEFL